MAKWMNGWMDAGEAEPDGHFVTTEQLIFRVLCRFISKRTELSPRSHSDTW